MQQSLGCGNVQCTCPQQGALSPLRLVDIISSHVYSILIYASALPHTIFCGRQGTVQHKGRKHVSSKGF